jgi:2-methylcitrate dehydratase PrpD
MDGITRTIAEFATKLTYEDLPANVVEKVKVILLDSIGCALGGYVVDRSRIALELVEELGGKPQATIIGNGKTSYTLAAFANGELMNALDFDANGPYCPHVIPYVIPACLSLSERVNSSGKDLITAVALGLEIGGRVASSLSQHRILKDEPPYYEWAPRFGFTTTIFGSAAGAGKILHLNLEQMLNALGIAGASTPVPANAKWEHTPGPAIMTKYNCWSGWISQLGTTAALAAEKGFTGDTTILDGEWGFWKIYGSPFFLVENLLGQLGQEWKMTAVHIKGCPVCKLNQSTVDAVNEIMLKNTINPEEIEEIIIQSDPTLSTPNRSQTEIKSFADTQFCSTLIGAIAVYHGRQPGPAWALPSTYEDPRILNLMKKTRILVHPKAIETNMSQVKAGKLQGYFGATVEITAGGKKYVADVLDAKGSPSNPLTAAEVLAKFKNNASYSGLRGDKVEKFIDMVHNLDKVPDMANFMQLLSTSGD